MYLFKLEKKSNTCSKDPPSPFSRYQGRFLIIITLCKNPLIMSWVELTHEILSGEHPPYFVLFVYFIFCYFFVWIEAGPKSSTKDQQCNCNHLIQILSRLQITDSGTLDGHMVVSWKEHGTWVVGEWLCPVYGNQGTERELDETVTMVGWVGGG